MIRPTHEADFKQEFYGAVRQGITGSRLVRHVRQTATYWFGVITDKQIKSWGEDLKKKCKDDDEAMRAQNRARIASFQRG